MLLGNHDNETLTTQDRAIINGLRTVPKTINNNNNNRRERQTDRQADRQKHREKRSTRILIQIWRQYKRETSYLRIKELRRRDALKPSTFLVKHYAVVSRK